MKRTAFNKYICLVLALLLLPVANVFAATFDNIPEEVSAITQTISELRVEIEVPAGGRAPSFEAKAFPSSMVEYKISSGTNVEESVVYPCFFKNGIQWYDLDNGRALKEGEAFVTGTRYRVDIIIRQTYDTDFYGTPYYKYADDLKGYVNGAEADVTSGILPLDKKWFRQLSYTFPPCEEVPDDITSVSLWLDSPVAGATPDFTYTTSDKGYKAGEGGTDAVNGVTWYDSTGNTISSSMKFAEGETYSVAIELDAVSPYMFATKADGTSKVSARINGYGATVYCSYQEVADMDETIWVRYTFPTCKKVINSVELMNFNLPREGQKGEFDMSTPDKSIYKTTDVVWKDSAGNSIAVWHSSTGYRTQNGVFEAGVTYTVEVTLTAGTGYEFATDGSGNSAVVASAAGFELETSAHYAYSASSYIIVSGRFICRQTYVTNVSIINLDEPLAGKRPDYSANSIGVGYRIETEREAKDSVWENGGYVDRYYKYAGVAWYDVTENRYIYENETFIQGHVYTVYIDIVADSDSDYEFKLNTDSYYGTGVSATVDGNQALAVAKTSNALWNHYVEYTVSCQYVYEDGDEPTEGTKGDVNGDGYVDNLDAAAILKYDAGISDLSSKQRSAADVNRDGYVDNLDAAKILKYDAGIIDSL